MAARTVVWAPLLLVVGLVAGVMIAYGLLDPATSSDLTPGRIRGCNEELVTRQVSLNIIAAEGYTAGEADALRTLSSVCYTSDVYPHLDPHLLGLLARSPIPDRP